MSVCLCIHYMSDYLICFKLFFLLFGPEKAPIGMIIIIVVLSIGCWLCCCNLHSTD